MSIVISTLGIVAKSIHNYIFFINSTLTQIHTLYKHKQSYAHCHKAVKFIISRCKLGINLSKKFKEKIFFKNEIKDSLLS